MTTELLVLINEESGRVREEGAEQIRHVLSRVCGDEISPRFITASVPELMEEARTCTAGKVVSAGGDGTIAGIASSLHGRDDKPVFIPLPYGTANLIPRDIGFPLDPEEALRIAITAPSRMIDYVDVNGSPMLHSAAFGTFAEMAEGRETFRSAPTFGDAVGAATDMWDRFIETHAVRYQVQVDGESLSVESSALFVVNNAITSGETALPNRARLDGGELVVYISKTRGVLGLVQHVVEAIAGGFHESEDFIRRTGQTVRVETDERRLNYTIDGEPGQGEEALNFTMVPKSLKVPDLRGRGGQGSRERLSPELDL